MIITIGVLFVTGLMLAAAYAVATDEISTTRSATNQEQAYYAALAGVQEYAYLLQANPDHWQTCEGLTGSLPGESAATYEVTVLPAHGSSKCESSNPFQSAIQSEGELPDSFRIESVGKGGKSLGKASETRSLIATFKPTGFLNYLYFTNFETEDPSLYSAPSGCAGKYYSEWSKEKLNCQAITFTSADNVTGPMHTNDAAKVSGAVEFGRPKQTPPDVVEIYGGTYPEDENEKCSESPIFYTATKCYVKGERIVMPEGDTSLEAYVESEDEFSGETRLELKGAESKIHVVNYNEKGEKKEETINWPANGLIYVKSQSCGWPVSGSNQAENADGSTEAEDEKGCGNVYVRGSYSKSLTVGAQDDLIINGNIYPTSVEKLGAAPTGTTSMGLIADNYVRVYHPCSNGTNVSESQDPNKWGALSSPWIYAAILSTDHSFVVDNWTCGASLGELNVYGAIAQDYRGAVGTASGGKISSGYAKNYLYDSRLETDEPPHFLAPLKSGWKVVRETAPSPG